MTTSYTNTEMRDFLHHMVWITADQTTEFDDILRRPIKRLEGVQTYYQQYKKDFLLGLEAERKLGAAAPLYDYVDERTFIANLESSGENVERIFLWLKAMESHGAKRDGRSAGQGPFLNWYYYFNRTCRGSYIPVVNVQIGQLTETFRQDVFIPLANYRPKRKLSAAQWLAGPQNRSAYDEFLWKTYYEDLQISPATMFSDYPQNIYFRRWWRKYRDFLNAEEKDIMFNDLVKFMQDPTVSDVTVTKWENIWPIDEAIDIDNIPDFELYAASAK